MTKVIKAPILKNSRLSLLAIEPLWLASIQRVYTGEYSSWSFEGNMLVTPNMRITPESNRWSICLPGYEPPQPVRENYSQHWNMHWSMKRIPILRGRSSIPIAMITTQEGRPSLTRREFADMPCKARGGYTVYSEVGWWISLGVTWAGMAFFLEGAQAPVANLVLLFPDQCPSQIYYSGR